ncbi:MAG: hypothetical protein EB059_05110 [Alphaproteobacteria bacterium]|nr:hypothetical protein [Alphaproteobacteria bacterium]
MTTEVAIMNRRAVVLSADSAGTVTSWQEGKQETRYFKGENKIFQLSLMYPIGIMIYSNSSLHGIPWEIIIKHYRSEHKDHHPLLSDYCEHFLNWLNDNDYYFSSEFKQQIILDKLKEAALQIILPLIQQDNFKVIQEAEKKIQFIKTYLEGLLTKLEQIKLIGSLDIVDLQASIAEYENKAADFILKIFHAGMVADINIVGLAPIILRTCMNILYREHDFHDLTGIVIAGYGEKEFFPCLYEYKIFGFAGKKLAFSKKNERKISLVFPRFTRQKLRSINELGGSYERNKIYSGV